MTVKASYSTVCLKTGAKLAYIARFTRPRELRPAAKNLKPKPMLSSRLQNIGKLIIGLAILCYSFNANSQEIAWSIHLEEKDGLNSRIIEKITRSDDGYFYLLMNKSVQRYDGKNFENLDIDSDFITENRELQNICFLNDNYPLIQQDNSVKNSFLIVENQLQPLIQSPYIESSPLEGSIFISGNQRELFVLEKVQDSIYNLLVPSTSEMIYKNATFRNLPAKLLYDRISSTILAEHTNGRIYVQNKDEILELQGRLIYRNNEILLLNNTGVFSWNNGGFDKIVPLTLPKLSSFWAKADKKGNILFALNTSVATIEQLILLLPTNEIRNYNNLLGLSENIKDVYADDFEDEMLLATYNGLFSVAFPNKGISEHFVRPHKSNAEFGNVISGLAYSSHSDKVYFTKEIAGLYTLEEDSIILLSSHRDFKNNNFITISQDGKILISTAYNFDGSGRINLYDIEMKSHKSTKIPFIASVSYQLSPDSIFIGGSSKEQNFIRDRGTASAAIYQISTRELLNVDLPAEITNHQIRSFLHIPQLKQYWLATINGTFCLDENFGLRQAFDENQELAIHRIKEDHSRIVKYFDGKVWIGTRNDGIYVLDPLKKEIQLHINEESGLNDNAAISLEQDSAGNIWVGTFQGINVIDKNGKVINSIHDDQGLSNPEFNTMASCITKEDKMFFGSINGISKIDPINTLLHKRKSRFVVEKMIAFQNGSTKEFKAINNSAKIAESIDSIQLTFNFPSYYQHHYQNSFRNLEVINPEKQSLSFKNNTLTVRDLQVGKFTLGFLPKAELQAYSYSFQVQRNLIPWLISFLILLAGVMLWFSFSSLKKKNERKLQEEKIKFNKQLAELELTALRSQMNPHFIFNALGAIQYFINTRDIEKADEYLAKFAKLMRLILESSKSKYIRLEDEINLLKLYTSLEHIRFEEKFEYSIEICDELDTASYKIPSMIIQPFVENAINHGLYHLEGRKGSLLIYFEEVDDDHILCTISDNGIGREAAASIKSPTTHKSRGMQIVRERVVALKMDAKFEIDFTIKDLEAETTGTVVEISVKTKE